MKASQFKKVLSRPLIAAFFVLVGFGMYGCDGSDCADCDYATILVRLTDVPDPPDEVFLRFEVYYSGEDRNILPPLASGYFYIGEDPAEGYARDRGERIRPFSIESDKVVYAWVDKDWDGVESSGDLALSVENVVQGIVPISYNDLELVP